MEVGTNVMKNMGQGWHGKVHESFGKPSNMKILTTLEYLVNEEN